MRKVNINAYSMYNCNILDTVGALAKMLCLPLRYFSLPVGSFLTEAHFVYIYICEL